RTVGGACSGCWCVPRPIRCGQASRHEGCWTTGSSWPRRTPSRSGSWSTRSRTTRSRPNLPSPTRRIKPHRRRARTRVRRAHRGSWGWRSSPQRWRAVSCSGESRAGNADRTSGPRNETSGPRSEPDRRVGRPHPPQQTFGLPPIEGLCRSSPQAKIMLTRRRVRCARRGAPMACRSLRVLFTAVTSAVAITLGAAPSHAAEKIPEGDLPQALVNYVASPDAVAGANDWSCKPSKDKPHPVVLLPGTFFNIGVNFVKIAPRLHNEGYCVFATNYGMTSVSLGRVGGLKHIPESAKELDVFVDKVLRATGAEKVDIIGHSQGGNVPMYWMKKMGNAHKVAHYVGWAPSSHGTSVDGVVTLAHKLRLLGFAM